MARARVLLTVCLGGATAACAVESEPELGEVPEEPEEQYRCAGGICGVNGPRLGKWEFHDLEIFGQENDDGFAIKEFRRNGGSHFPYVVGSQLWAWDYAAGQWIWGQDLAGAEFVIDYRGGWRQFVLRIQAVGEMTYPVPDWDPDPIETYVLEFKPSTGGIASDNVPWTSICGGFPGGIGEWGGGSGQGEDLQYWEQWELLGQSPVETILFQGDRIHGDTFTVDPSAQWNWFNIGCAGHAVSKLHLTRNTIASDYGASWEERQATFKMLAGDYCGLAIPFTVTGQHLVWQDQHVPAWVEFFRYPQTLEARWNENGAICIGEPRMKTPTTSYGANMFNFDVEKEILLRCGAQAPPRCADVSDTDPWNFAGALRVSANPGP